MSVRMGKPSAFTPARMRRPSLRPGPRYVPPEVRLALSKDALKTNSPTASRMPRARRCTCSSLSMTHGPAMSTKGWGAPWARPNAPYSIATGVDRLLPRLFPALRQAAPPVLIGGPNERLEQGMRLHGLGLELGMELAAEIPRMIGDLADFDVGLVGRLAGDPQSRGFQPFFIFAIELIAVAVALVDLAHAIGAVGETVLGQLAGPAAQPHGAAEVVHAFQLAQLEDHAVRRSGVEFGGIGARQAAHVAGEFDDQGLHAQADAEIGHLALAGVADGVEHAVDAALAEAARDEDAVVAFELPFPSLAHHAFGIDPVNIDLQLMRQPAVQQGLLQALVRVFVIRVLAHQADGHLVARAGDALQHGGPSAHLARAGIDAQQPEDHLVHSFGGEVDRHLVHRLDVARGDDGLHVHVAEERDFLLHLLGDETLRTAQQDVGLDTDGAQLLDAVLGGLGLQLLGRGDKRHQGHVDEQGVVAPLLMAHLADVFEERQRFNVAHGAADFEDHHVHVLRHLLHGGLDLIGDVRNHLHGLAQVIAAALTGDDLLVDAAGGQVVGLRQLGVGESLVVAEIEVGLRAVVGDEHFAVLEGAHGARVHVEVVIAFLAGDLQPAALQQTPDRSGGDALSQRRDHAARYENVFSHTVSPPAPSRRRTTCKLSRGPRAYPLPRIRTRSPPRGFDSRFRARAIARAAPPVPTAPPAARNIPAGNPAGTRKGRCA